MDPWRGLTYCRLSLMISRRYLPVEVDVDGRLALCVGADLLIDSKIARLLAAGAEVVVYDGGGEVAPDVARRAAEGEVRLVNGAPDRRELEAASVIFVSPAQEAIAAAIYDWARDRARLVSTLDRPERSTFVNPAVLDTAGVGLRIVSGGASPALVKRLREDLEALLSDPRLAVLVERLAALRADLPRGERAAALRVALEGFALTGSLRFPAWLDRPSPGPKKG
jgi:siroheme synthase-like protein